MTNQENTTNMTNQESTTNTPNQNGRQVRKLSIVLNSGHHYFDIPFKDICGTPDNAGSRWVESLQVDALNPLRRWRCLKTLPFMLFRIAKRESVALLSFVIETNCWHGTETLSPRGTPLKDAELVIFDRKQPFNGELFCDSQACYIQESQKHYHEIPGTVEGDPKYKFSFSLSDVLRELGAPFAGDIDVVYEVFCTSANVGNTREASLIMDMGNSRTMGLLWTEPPGANKIRLSNFGKDCQPLQFQPHGLAPEEKSETGETKNTVLPSLLLLRPPAFRDDCFAKNTPLRVEAHWVTETTVELSGNFIERAFRWLRGLILPNEKTVKKQRILQHCFVEISPTTTAAPSDSEDVDSADYLLRNGKTLGHIFLSSPKRYAWATASSGRTWYEHSFNPYTCVWSKSNAQSLLTGVIRYFMDKDGTILSAETRPDPDAAPTYCEADAITWFGLGLLERASCQLNPIEEYNSSIHRHRAKLTSVQLTFPGGWMQTELESYKKRWDAAAVIFERSRFEKEENPGQLKIETDLDEAAASQLPFVAADISQLDETAAEWLKLYGRKTANCPRKVRALCVDFGGGTCDVAVLDYAGGRTEGKDTKHEIHTSVIYRFSSTLAGDNLQKRILQEILQPRLKRTVPDFHNFLKAEFAEKAVGQQLPRHVLSRLVRILLLPLTEAYFRKDIFKEGSERFQALRQRFKDAFDSLELHISYNSYLPQAKRKAPDDTTPYSVDLSNAITRGWDDHLRDVNISKIISENVKNLFKDVAHICKAFDVDLVYISGKPSELEDFQKVVREELAKYPVSFAKGFYVGEYYPAAFAADGKISDAKSVTVVGAALYRAFNNKRVHNFHWTISPPSETTRQIRPNEWGILNATGTKFDYVEDEENEDVRHQKVFFKGGSSVDPKNEAQGFERIDSVTVRLRLNASQTIGFRSRFCPNVPPNCVYVLKKNGFGNTGPDTTDIFLKILYNEQTGGEELKCDFVNPADANRFDFCFDTRGGSLFWMDDPKYLFSETDEEAETE